MNINQNLSFNQLILSLILIVSVKFITIKQDVLKKRLLLTNN